MAGHGGNATMARRARRDRTKGRGETSCVLFLLRFASFRFELFRVVSSAAARRHEKARAK